MPTLNLCSRQWMGKALKGTILKIQVLVQNPKLSSTHQFFYYLLFIIYYLLFIIYYLLFIINWRASEASETLSSLFNRESRIYILNIQPFQVEYRYILYPR